jgi:hypothetical protein
MTPKVFAPALTPPSLGFCPVHGSKDALPLTLGVCDWSWLSSLPANIERFSSQSPKPKHFVNLVVTAVPQDFEAVQANQPFGTFPSSTSL